MINPLKLLEKCPEDLKIEYQDMMHNSRLFLRALDIDYDDDFGEVKVELEEAKGQLLSLLSNFITILNLANTKKKKIDTDEELIMQIRFEQDVGEVISSIKDKHIYDIGGDLTLSTLLKGAGELKIVYESLIYQPIIRANHKGFKKIDDYILFAFALVSSNVSILGASERSSKSRGKPIKAEKPIYTKILEKLNRKDQESTEEPEEEEKEEEEDEDA